MFSNNIPTIKERLYSRKFIYLVIDLLQKIGNFWATNRGGPMNSCLSVSKSVTSFSRNLLIILGPPSLGGRFYETASVCMIVCQ